MTTSTSTLSVDSTFEQIVSVPENKVLMTEDLISAAHSYGVVPAPPEWALSTMERCYLPDSEFLGYLYVVAKRYSPHHVDEYGLARKWRGESPLYFDKTTGLPECFVGAFLYAAGLGPQNVREQISIRHLGPTLLINGKFLSQRQIQALQTAQVRNDLGECWGMIWQAVRASIAL